VVAATTEWLLCGMNWENEKRGGIIGKKTGVDKESKGYFEKLRRKRRPECVKAALSNLRKDKEKHSNAVL